jgi:hypothetical protein
MAYITEVVKRLCTTPPWRCGITVHNHVITTVFVTIFYNLPSTDATMVGRREACPVLFLFAPSG